MQNMTISFELIANVTAAKIWRYYTKLDRRKCWETDLEEFLIEGEMKSGATGTFKLENSPPMDVLLKTVTIEKELTEQFTIPEMGILIFSHQIETISASQSIIKAFISLEPNINMPDNVCYQFMKQVSDDIMTKAFKLKELVEN